jgi:hypothetical protein
MRPARSPLRNSEIACRSRWGISVSNRRSGRRSLRGYTDIYNQ